jgi:UDP:flavonoid glycosyltransferase YjiC (YdhE family)
MVALPLGGDQAANARRCAVLGVARVLPPDQRTPDAIRTAVREVLDDPRYRANAQALRAQFQALPGPERAVQLLEQLATHGAIPNRF